MRRSRRRTALAGGLVWALAIVPSANADEPGATKGRVIEEIVVTAQKTEQNIQDVPVSITAITGDFVRDAALTDLVDIMRYAPNVQFYENASLFASFNIRGFATPPLAIGLEPSVGLVIDDVPYGRSTYAQDAVFDLERLEILRGPQGALFGKNTVGGVLNFTTGEPSFDPQGYLSIGAGSLAERRAEGAIAFPIVNDVFAGRFAFRADGEHLGVFDTTRGETDQVRNAAGRLKLLWQPTKDLDVHLTAWTSHQSADGAIVQLEHASARSLEVFRQFDPQTEDDPFDGRTAIDEKTSSGRTAYSLSPKAEWTLGNVGPIGDLKLTGIASWSRIANPYDLDPDFSPIHLGHVGSDGDNPYEQLSFELRTAGRAPAPLGWGSGVDFVGGLYGDKTESTIRQLFDVDLNGAIAYLAAGAKSSPGQIGPIVPEVPQSVLDELDALVGSNALPDILTGPAAPLATLRPIPPSLATEHLLSATSHDKWSVAGFGQGTWHVADRWDLTLGLRIGYDQQKADIFAHHTGFGVGAALADEKDFDAHLRLTELDVSPKGAVTYRWSDSISLYASAARGFKEGGFDNAPLNPDHLKYDAEKGTSFETGLKSRLLDGTVAFNAAAYYSFLDNLQVRNFTGVTFTTANADKSRSRGIELDAEWLPPLEGLNVAASLGLIDAEFVRFPNGTATAESGAKVQDLSGRPLPYTPKVSASFNPSIALPLIPRWGIGSLFGVDVLYRAGRFLDSDLDPATFQGATTRVNVRLGILPKEGSWSIVLSGKNLTGAKERLLIIDQPLLQGNFVAFPLVDDPTFTVAVRYTFGARS